MPRSPQQAPNANNSMPLVRITPPIPASVSFSSSSQEDTHFSHGVISTLVYALGEKGMEVEFPPSAIMALNSLVSISTRQLEHPVQGTLSLTFEGARKFDFSVDRQFANFQTDIMPDQGIRFFLPIDDTKALHDFLSLVRKDQHIALCASTNVEASDQDRGLNDVYLMPMSLPEISWEEISIQCEFLGNIFHAPLCITGMTGGLEKGAMINRNLAMVAEKLRIPMGVGSQRIALDHPEHARIFSVKKEAPKVYLIGNLGIAQLVQGSLEQAYERAQGAVDMIEADALAIHANVLQEAVQVEGDRDFRGVFRCLEHLVHKMKVPIILKEVGVGVDPQTAGRLMDLGIAAIDIGGKGGTSWSFIEGLRSADPSVRHLGETFRDWGLPTGVALYLAALEKSRKQSPISLMATGGLRHGLHVAQCLSLGANICGIGLPLLKAAMRGPEEVEQVLLGFIAGLKTAMIATGSPTLGHLKKRRRLGKRFKDEVDLWSDLDGSAFESKFLMRHDSSIFLGKEDHPCH